MTIHVSEHDLWNTGNSVVKLAPSPGDLFVAALVHGKVAFCWPITEYQRAVRQAEDFARRVKLDNPFTVKVLSLTAWEGCTVLGINPATLFSDDTAEQEATMRTAGIAACMDALRSSNEPAVRAEAYETLKMMKEK
jgi:hypothetical protein